MQCNAAMKPRLSLKLGSKHTALQQALLQPLQSSAECPTSSEGAGPPAPTGLLNLGNTCYTNSVLQVLRFCPGFCSGVAALQAQLAKQGNGPSLVFLLHQLFQKMLLAEVQKTQSAVRPESFISKLKEDNPVFAGSQQQDAQELMRFLLVSIQNIRTAAATLRPHLGVSEHNNTPPTSATLDSTQVATVGRKRRADGQCGTVTKAMRSLEGHGRVACKPLTEYYGTDRPTIACSTEDATCSLDCDPKPKQSEGNDLPLKANSDFINDTFQGHLIFQTRCYECDALSQRTEPFLDISVPVSSESLPGFPPSCSPAKHSSLYRASTQVGSYSLSWALSQFASREKLRGVNKFWCDYCRHFVEAEHSIMFAELPNIVTIHLNRFTTQGWSHFSAAAVGKIGGSLAIPLTLSLHPWCSPHCTGKDRLYELFAVVFHSGSTCHSGHYTACVRAEESPAMLLQVAEHIACEWVYFNDDDVGYLSQPEVLDLLSPLSTGSTTAYILLYRVKS